MIPVAELRAIFENPTYSDAYDDLAEEFNVALPPDGVVLSGDEVAQIREALPDPSKLDWLAEWLDRFDEARGVSDQHDVQDDLRRWATAGRAALSLLDSTGEET